MKKMLGAAVAVAVIAFAGAAGAGEAKGVIKAIDTANRLVTLADGTIYKIGTNMAMPAMAVGDTIAITFTVAQIPQNNVDKATVTPAPKAAAK